VIAGDPKHVFADTESGEGRPLRLLGSEDESGYDFASFETVGAVDANRIPLQPPGTNGLPKRGSAVEFAGFPHGIGDLLVQRGTVAGFDADDSIYIDASVNGGSSGGPVVDPSTHEGVWSGRREAPGVARRCRLTLVSSRPPM